jgi:hypothetical protein
MRSGSRHEKRGSSMSSGAVDADSAIATCVPHARAASIEARPNDGEDAPHNNDARQKDDYGVHRESPLRDWPHQCGQGRVRSWVLRPQTLQVKVVVWSGIDPLPVVITFG